jgi:diguanylate cyclase
LWIVHDPGPASCAGIRVLVVDDYEDTRDLLDHILTRAGAIVRLAASASEALPLLDDVDIVVTDYSMPGGTGLWLLGQVRGRVRPVPVIVMTAYSHLHLTELLTAPFARVRTKPIDPWAICRDVQEVVRQVREAGG